MRYTQGLIKTIVVIVVIVAILGYFSFDLRTFFENPQVKANFAYIFGWISFVWNEYMGTTFSYLWNDIFLNFIWQNTAASLEKIQL